MIAPSLESVLSKEEKKKITMKTMPDDGTTPDDGTDAVPYIPGKFPKGKWKIIAFEKIVKKNMGHIKLEQMLGGM